MFLVSPAGDAAAAAGPVHARREHRPRDLDGHPTAPERLQVPLRERGRRGVPPAAPDLAHLCDGETAAHREGVRAGAATRFLFIIIIIFLFLFIIILFFKIQ